MTTRPLPAPEVDPDAEFLDRAEAEIRSLGRISVEAMLRIGSKLCEVHDRIGAERCVEWVADRFGWARSSVFRMMQAAECARSKLGRLTADELALFDVSAIYLLAQPSTPEDVRDAAASEAKRGNRVSHGRVKRWIDDGDDDPIPPPDPMLAHLRPLVGALRQLASLDLEPAALAVVLEPDLRGVLAERVDSAMLWLGHFRRELTL